MLTLDELNQDELLPVTSTKLFDDEFEFATYPPDPITHPPFEIIIQLLEPLKPILTLLLDQTELLPVTITMLFEDSEELPMCELLSATTPPPEIIILLLDPE